MRADKTMKDAWHSFFSRQRQTKHSIDMNREEFIEWWALTGHLLERGAGPNQYCMSIIDTKQPYSTDNVECITNKERVRKVSIRKGIKVSTPDGIFDTIADASKYYGVQVGTIRRRCNKLTGWSFI